MLSWMLAPLGLLVIRYKWDDDHGVVLFDVPSGFEGKFLRVTEDACLGEYCTVKPLSESIESVELAQLEKYEVSE